MTLAPSLRKSALTTHVIASAGWIGGVACFLALAIAGQISSDPHLIQASYVAMDFTYRTVVIPLGLMSLVTGIVSSLGTEWGLIRHYWVLLKLLLTIPAVNLMLVHVQPVEIAARAASSTAFSVASLGGLRFQLVVYASAALLFLLVATVLSTYKPRGRTRYGIRKLAQRG